MAMNWAQHSNPKKTPQSAPIFGKKMAENSAGGFGFAIDKWAQLDRFLIIGTEGGTYYASEKKLTKENAENLLLCIGEDGPRVVRRVVEISDAGRAPKNDPALFALAVCAAHGDGPTRHGALSALPTVARIGTHLFHFAEFVQMFRGWGRGLRRGIADWYLAKDYDDLAYQLVKYKQRDGWSHRDLIRLSHPKPGDVKRERLLGWAVGKGPHVGVSEKNVLPEVIEASTRLAACKDPAEAALIIAAHRLPREVVPTELLNETLVWEALCQDMPTTALVRNLGKLGALGMLDTLGKGSVAKLVVDKLTDEDAIRRSRIHPISILSALKVYQQGHGEKGNLSWNPAGPVCDALDEAFKLAFGNVVPTGKPMMIALDISGSMWNNSVAGIPGLDAATAAAAMALITALTEETVEIIAFTTKVAQIKLTKKTTLTELLGATEELSANMDGTDCSLPMVLAIQKKWAVNTFVVYTDNETWAGDIHPSQALREYRQASGLPARSVVCGMTSTGFSIADPADAGMLDVVGLDSATPQLISSFARGEF